MASLRLVGDPEEIALILASVRGVLHVADVTGPSPSRKTAGHVLVYAHVEPVGHAEVVPDGQRSAPRSSPRSTLSAEGRRRLGR